MARHLGLPHRYVAGASVFGPNRGGAERCIQRAFQECGAAAVAEEGAGAGDQRNQQPSILIVDELEALGKARAQARHVADLGALGALLEALDAPAWRRRVFVIGVAADAQRLDPALLQPGRLESVIRLSTPSAAQRRVVLEGLLGRLPLRLPGEGGEGGGRAQELAEELTRRTRGFTGADVARLCSEALAGASSRCGPDCALAVEREDWEAALEAAQPAGIPWAGPGDAALSDLAGMGEAVRMVTQAVLLPLTHPQALAAMGIPRASMGVLLHGPPGTGKSLLGRALAAGTYVSLRHRQFNSYCCVLTCSPAEPHPNAAARPYASFLSVECPELVNKVVGESERAVARLFQAARQAAPCILFLDHIEAVAGRRGFDTSSEQTMDRLLSTLLVEMDGVGVASSSPPPPPSPSGPPSGGAASAPVIVIAATNHRDLLDEALLRPGRLDLHVELPLPDLAARVAIFAHHLRRLPLAFDDDEEEEEGNQDQDVEGLAEALAARVEGLSGADIEGVCQEAALQSLRESLESAAVRPRHVWAALLQEEAASFEPM